MLIDEIEGHEVADPLLELRRSFEVAEQKGQAQDLEALADGERVRPVDVAEGLIGEKPLRCEHGLATPEEPVQCLVHHPDGRQYAAFSAVFESQVERPRAQAQSVDRNRCLVKDHRESFCRFALDVEEPGRMRDRIEGVPAGWQVDDFERDLPQQFLQIGRKIDRRAPEDSIRRRAVRQVCGPGSCVGVDSPRTSP